MNRFTIYTAILATTLILASACNDTPYYPKDSDTTDSLRDGIYILCEGLFNQNNSTLAYYGEQRVQKDIFLSVNGRKVGDTANHIIKYGSKLYIAVTVSSTIEVIEAATGKSIAIIPITHNSTPSQPRAITGYRGEIYICNYDGTVMQIDTTTFTISNITHAGRNPDDIVAHNGKLYVSNSGGLDFDNPDNTVSVVDIDTFREIKRIKVHSNPGSMAIDDEGYLFVVSRGKYETTTQSYNPLLQQIDTNTDSITHIYHINVNNVTSYHNMLYMYGQDATTIQVMDTYSGKIVNDNLLNGITSIKRIYGVDIDHSNGDIYVCDAIDYVTPGTIYCFTSKGEYKGRISSVGINPNSVVFAKLNNSVKVDSTNGAARTPTQVLDYTPAPGQFVNVLPLYTIADNDSSMREKCLMAVSSADSGLITLGGFGGSITFAFTPAIRNREGKADFLVMGNAFGGNAEPGVIWVSTDKNQNGVADDIWYEIAGSEHRLGNITPNYTITYIRPENDTESVKWIDNQGDKGDMIRIDDYHPQPYYPEWIEEDTIILSGTLIHHSILYERGSWRSYAKDWGYADNQPNSSEWAKIELDWAIDSYGRSVNLDSINFIKIVTGVHNQAEIIGELSTEINTIIVLND